MQITDRAMVKEFGKLSHMIDHGQTGNGFVQRLHDFFSKADSFQGRNLADALKAKATAKGIPVETKEELQKAKIELRRAVDAKLAYLEEELPRLKSLPKALNDGNVTLSEVVEYRDSARVRINELSSSYSKLESMQNGLLTKQDQALAERFKGTVPFFMRGVTNLDKAIEAEGRKIEQWAKEVDGFKVAV